MSCACPRRLAYTTVDTLIGKLRSIFNQLGRNYNEATLPGYGNPAADISVKKYLAAVREEQLQARTLPTQAQPIFLHELAIISKEVLRNLKNKSNTSSQTYIYAPDQAFFKIQFFAGDRAGDLGRTKSKELLYSPDKEVVLFNHMITKSLRDGSTNLFGITRYKDPALCPVVALEDKGTCSDPPVRWVKLCLHPVYLCQKHGGNLSGTSCHASRFKKWMCTDRSAIMEHVGWKTDPMAQHNVKLQQVLSTEGACEMLSRLPDNLTDEYHARNTLQGFTQAL